MPSFFYFLLLLGIAAACLFALRFALLRTGRHLQARIGFSDTTLADLVITIPLITFVIVFVAGLMWLLLAIATWFLWRATRRLVKGAERTAELQ